MNEVDTYQVTVYPRNVLGTEVPSRITAEQLGDLLVKLGRQYGEPVAEELDGYAYLTFGDQAAVVGIQGITAKSAYYVFKAEMKAKR